MKHGFHVPETWRSVFRVNRGQQSPAKACGSWARVAYWGLVGNKGIYVYVYIYTHMEVSQNKGTPL